MCTPLVLLILIMWVFIMLIGSGLFLEKVIYKNLWPDNVYYLSHTKLEAVYFIAGIIVMVIFVYLFRRKGVGGNNLIGDGVGITCNLPWKNRCKIMGNCLIVWGVIFALNAATYDRFDNNGICSRILFWEKSYNWDEVQTYNIEAGFDDTLEFTLITMDGNKYTVIGGLVGTLYEEKPKDMEDYEYTNYIKDVVSLLHKEGKDPSIDWQEAENEMMEYWADYTEELHSIVME